MKTSVASALLLGSALALLAPATSSAQVVLWESLFNTPGQTTADDGGFMGGFYGGGDPFFQADGAVALDTGTAGLGPDGSSCLRVFGSGLTMGANYAFFGTFIQNEAGPQGPTPPATGLDISGGDVIKFSLKLGAPGAHQFFAVKLEDIVPTGGGDFNNTNAQITPAPNATTWTDYEFPLSTFTAGAQPVDLTIFGQVVIEAQQPPLGGTAELHLLIDNIQVVQNASSVQDWELLE